MDNSHPINSYIGFVKAVAYWITLGCSVASHRERTRPVAKQLYLQGLQLKRHQHFTNIKATSLHVIYGTVKQFIL